MPKGNTWSSVPLPYYFFLFIFFVNFDVNRAAAPKGTEGDLKTMLTITLATMEVIELET